MANCSSHLQWILCVGLCSLIGPTHPSEAAVTATMPPQPAKTAWFASYEEGMRFAKTQGRPVLLEFGAAWCGWCKKLDEEVLSQAPVVGELEKFVCIKVDVDKSPQVARAYAVRSLPRMLVINTHEEIVGDWLGYRERDAFLTLIRDIQSYTHSAMGTLATPKHIAVPADPNVLAASGPSFASLGLPEQLGHRDPALRRQAIAGLVDRGPEALPLVLPLLNHPYLGVRIGAWKVVTQLHATDVTFDPWAPRAERHAIYERLVAVIGDR